MLASSRISRKAIPLGDPMILWSLVKANLQLRKLTWGQSVLRGCGKHLLAIKFVGDLRHVPASDPAVELSVSENLPVCSHRLYNRAWFGDCATGHGTGHFDGRFQHLGR